MSWVSEPTWFPSPSIAPCATSQVTVLYFEAAAALMEGVVVTTDIGLRNELLRLYQSGVDTMGCATMPVQGNTALNPSCPIVQRHLCAAAVGIDAEEWSGFALAGGGCRGGWVYRSFGRGGGRRS